VEYFDTWHFLQQVKFSILKHVQRNQFFNYFSSFKNKSTRSQKRIKTHFHGNWFEGLFNFLGTSSGIPLVSCLTKTEKTCKTCLDAIKPNSKNNRRNTSILLQKKVDGEFKNVLIDCGKFFFHGALNILPKFNIQRIDAVLLTHEHLGLNFFIFFTQKMQPEDWMI
jgi:hypothetical protein